MWQARSDGRIFTINDQEMKKALDRRFLEFDE
jgi:hypothetical protein